MTSNKICKVPVFQECSQISSSAWIWRERPMSGKIMRTTQTKVEIGACKYVYRTMIEKNTIESSFILPLFCCYYCFLGFIWIGSGASSAVLKWDEDTIWGVGLKPGQLHAKQAPGPLYYLSNPNNFIIYCHNKWTKWRVWDIKIT